MDRRAFLATVAFSTLAVPLGGEAQPTGKVYRIGVLGLRVGLEATVREGLRELGWVEGQNVAFEWRYWKGEPETLRAAAADLVGLKMDLIISETGQGALAAKAATSTIPIVMMGSLDAVAQGLVASLARPGGNVTGVTFVSPELAAKRLQLLREVLPRAVRIGALHCSPTSGVMDTQWEATQAAARTLNVKLLSLDVHGPADAERAFQTASHQRAEAILVFDCTRNFPSPDRIVELAAQSRLPAMYPFALYVSRGGLMSYGADIREARRRALIHVDRILKGAKPADLPVEQPTKFEFVINMRTAKALGLTIPPSILVRADQIIE